MSDQHISLTEAAAKLVPQVYDDMLKPTIQESGKFLAIIPQTLNAMVSGVRQWNALQEAKLQEFEQVLAVKLKNTDPQKITLPDTYVSIPALQAVTYSMDSDELRNLYANLLAKSMNTDTKYHVHPMFVEIIKQMSPLDAKIFKIIMQREDNPLIDLVYKRDKDFLTEQTIIMSNLSDIDIASPQLVSLSIDNLAKQNLISIVKTSFCADNALYDKIMNSEFAKKQSVMHPDKPDGFKFSYNRHTLEVTNIGKAFYDICMTDFH